MAKISLELRLLKNGRRSYPLFCQFCNPKTLAFGAAQLLSLNKRATTEKADARLASRIEMKTHKFETNINCGSCVAAVTPALDAAVGAGNWSVDITKADKELRVNTDLAPETVLAAVQNAGYKISLKKFKLFG